MLDLTVAIPTFNGAERLPLVLDALQAQVGTEGLHWEVLVVDNNSRDRTPQVIQAYQSQWQHPWRLAACQEARPGLAFARQRAIETAAGRYVAFLDDDNLPAPNWVAAAYQFGEQHPEVGAFSGRIHARYEVEPPADFGQIAQFLAIRDRGSQPAPFEPQNLRLPPGAGLVVRRQAWLDAVPAQLAIVGNQGKALARGEDYEILLRLYQAGWEIWYNPDMILDHLIPHWRLERPYLLSLARSCGLATYTLRLVLASPHQHPFLMLKTLVGNSKRIALHLLKYRWQVQANPIAAFELNFYVYSFLSPIYHYWPNRQPQVSTRTSPPSS